MAVAGSGGWIPARKIHIGHDGLVADNGHTTNVPKKFVKTDPVEALIALWQGETIYVDARVTLGAVKRIVEEVKKARERHAALVDRETKRGDGH